MTTATAFDPALNLARQSLYRCLALSLLDPRASNWEQLRQLLDSRLLTDAAALIRDEPTAMAESLAFAELPLADLDPEFLLAALPVSTAALNDEFERAWKPVLQRKLTPN